MNINYPVKPPGSTWKKINLLALLKAYRQLRKLIKLWRKNHVFKKDIWGGTE